jgi:hypothetical protein
MWTSEFWKATAERMLRGGAAAGVSSFLVGDKVMDAFNVDLQEFGGLFLGGMAVSLLLSLLGNVTTGNGPSFNSTETVDPPVPPAVP